MAARSSSTSSHKSKKSSRSSTTEEGPEAESAPDRGDVKDEAVAKNRDKINRSFHGTDDPTLVESKAGDNMDTVLADLEKQVQQAVQDTKRRRDEFRSMELTMKLQEERAKAEELQVLLQKMELQTKKQKSDHDQRLATLHDSVTPAQPTPALAAQHTDAPTADSGLAAWKKELLHDMSTQRECADARAS